MTKEVDIILAEIICHDLELNANRVVAYSQNYDPPKDQGLYVIISTRIGDILGSTNRFNNETSKEMKSVVTFQNLDIDITSKNREAMERKEEVVMALTSAYSEQKQEFEQIRIFRIGRILDLSFIEGGSALHRYRISVVISNMKTKETTVEIFDKFSEEEKIS